ncbi:MAG TPA: dihydrolipoamide acetyltransferase family protein [Saprospiraceae bacterium]|nr:2-oxo acid dehydrogenase subunit E2 [Saprospiraceae bacterium]HRO09813.1 dihydrolipoamide acetyltransferase family protein [Saprospiraceae bacterium]HRP43068.1 dihydrolipoamide acetyltransferase family protein [Saprospiraceae bacterium]
MARVELVMPKMGESIIEATILKWVKQVGEKVSVDDTILEVATDKVDSEIPSPVEGVITEILFPEESVVEVGKVIAIIATEGENTAVTVPSATSAETKQSVAAAEKIIEEAATTATVSHPQSAVTGNDDRFYSPLVKSIAKEEGISAAELSTIPGSGTDNRVTKNDILNYLKNRTAAPATPQPAAQSSVQKAQSDRPAILTTTPSGSVEIVEMDRMRKLIAEHMVMSKQTSPHVTSFNEVDVTNLVKWREANKKKFAEKHGANITFTPIFIEAVAKAISDYPLINISVEGTNIIVKKDINIGMAAALPTGNLIVPVIKNANLLNLVGLANIVNDLSNRARNNKLKPEEIKDGTFTITNVGTFGSIMGTPIINQPQVAILATGAIVKKPAVVETEIGDVIAIRHKMFLSMSYDHRVVDGSLGGSFLKRVGEYLENFDVNTTF